MRPTGCFNTESVFPSTPLQLNSKSDVSAQAVMPTALGSAENDLLVSRL